MRKRQDTSAAFRRDIRRCRRRGLDINLVWAVVDLLINDLPLPDSARRHRLRGSFAGYWECHIGGDWILLWTEDADTIYLERTGTHDDVFGR